MLTIRKATQEDRVSICHLHIASISELCATHYSAQEIEAWVAQRTPEIYTEAIATRDFLAAEENDTLVGFGQVNCDTGEVEAVYVSPSHASQGVGSQLLRELERIAWKVGVRRLRVSASLNSVFFYSRAGYQVKKSGLHRLRSGTEVACVHMAKDLKS